MSDDDRDNDIESDADKRAHHNALERKRRDHIKDSFSGLRDSLPYFQGEKVRASRAQILKKAADYIQCMRRKNTAHQQDIDDLKKQNRHLEDQIRALGKKDGKNGKVAATLFEAFQFNSSKASSTSSDTDSDSNFQEIKRVKKIKTSV